MAELLGQCDRCGQLSRWHLRGELPLYTARLLCPPCLAHRRAVLARYEAKKRAHAAREAQRGQLSIVNPDCAAGQLSDAPLEKTLLELHHETMRLLAQITEEAQAYNARKPQPTPLPVLHKVNK